MRTFICRMQDMSPVFIIMLSEVEERLNGTCFRGRSLARAGNFMRYGSFRDFQNDMETGARLVKICREAIAESTSRAFKLRTSFDFKEYVGWSSTTDLELFSPQELERFPLNKSVTAMRVTDRACEAPLTKTVTMVMDFAKVDGSWLVHIRTIYPGKDVGDLMVIGGITDISEREKRAFFDWDHPGEPVRY